MESHRLAARRISGTRTSAAEPAAGAKSGGRRSGPARPAGARTVGRRTLRPATSARRCRRGPKRNAKCGQEGGPASSTRGAGQSKAGERLVILPSHLRRLRQPRPRPRSGWCVGAASREQGSAAVGARRRYPRSKAAAGLPASLRPFAVPRSLSSGASGCPFGGTAPPLHGIILLLFRAVPTRARWRWSR